jgi:hypothetical protein
MDFLEFCEVYSDIGILPLKIVVPFIGYKDIHKAKKLACGGQAR